MAGMGRVGIWSGLRSWDPGAVGAAAARGGVLRLRRALDPRRSGRRRARPLPRRARRHDRSRRGPRHPQHLAPRRRGRSRPRRPALWAASGDRFLLGLGVSHELLIGEEYVAPLAKMRSYLDELDAAGQSPRARPRRPSRPACSTWPASRSAGAHPYSVPPEHSAIARAGPRPRAAAGTRADRRAGAGPGRRAGAGPPVLRPPPAPAQLARTTSASPRLHRGGPGAAWQRSPGRRRGGVGQRGRHRGAWSRPTSTPAWTTCACRSVRADDGPSEADASGRSWRRVPPTERPGADEPGGSAAPHRSREGLHADHARVQPHRHLTTDLDRHADLLPAGVRGRDRLPDGGRHRDHPRMFILDMGRSRSTSSRRRRTRCFGEQRRQGWPWRHSTTSASPSSRCAEPRGRTAAPGRRGRRHRRDPAPGPRVVALLP